MMIELNYQIYKPFALQDLIKSEIIEENDITGCKNVPTILVYDCKCNRVEIFI